MPFRPARAITLLIGSVGLTAAAPVPTSTLTIQISNVRNASGVVHVDICPQKQFLGDNCIYVGDAQSHAGVTTVTVHNLPPGQYAAQVFHDENRNKKVDRALFGIPKEGVIVYQVQTPDPLGHRVNHLRPLILKTPLALSVGEQFVSDAAIAVTVTGAIPGGFSVIVEDRNASFDSGQLLSYGDAGTPGNVSNPMLVGFGGWQAFKTIFAGRNLAGQDRIYAVDKDGRLLSYGDSGTLGNVSNPDVVGFGGWQAFKHLFAGRNLAGQNRIYAVDKDGQLLSYGDAGTPGNVSSPDVVGFGGWQNFKFLFAGRNLAGQDRIYAVDKDGRLLSYGDAGTPGNVSDPDVVGFGGWQVFKFLFAGRDAAGHDRIYAVDQNGQLLAYGDSGGPGNVSNPMIVGFGGWRDFKFVFSGQGRIYAVTA